MPGADDIQPTANETLDRFLTGTITVLPFVGLGLACWQLWGSALHWHDVVVFAVMYLITGLGITVGFHRLFTHRAFQTKPWLRGVIAASGSMAIEGPITAWVADHRKHHAFSDQHGDPTARTWTTGTASRAPCAACGTRTGAGCSSTPSAATSSATPAT